MPDGYESPQIRVTTDPQIDFKPIGRSHGPDLLKLLEDAHHLAASGLAAIPPEVAPIPVDTTAQHQFSFSRLTGQLIRTQTAGWHALTLGEGRGASRIEPTPFVGDSGRANPASVAIDPRGLGTLVHDVLERIDFASGATAGLPSSGDIAAWCEHLAPAHVIQNTEHAARLARNLIERFTASPRGKQLAIATAIHREIEFLLAWPPGEQTRRGQYIQGYIDCLYQDATGSWHIVDYKTNDVTAGQVAQDCPTIRTATLRLRNRHRAQPSANRPRNSSSTSSAPASNTSFPGTTAARLAQSNMSHRTQSQPPSLNPEPLTPSPSCPTPTAQREFALEVAQKLRAAGFESLWAGGCVRDRASRHHAQRLRRRHQRHARSNSRSLRPPPHARRSAPRSA